MSRSIPAIASAALATPALRGWRAASLYGLAALLLLFLLGGGQSAFAQDDSNSTYWLQERARERALSPPPQQPHVVQRPTHLIRRAAPVRGFAREVPPGETPPGTEPQEPAPTDAATLTPTAEPANGSFVVAVLGDSLGDMLAQGLSEAFADKPEYVIVRKTRDNSGLVRDDYYDWMKAARDLLAGPDKIGAAVMMIGSNDRQQIHDGTSTVDLHTPRWKQLYTARVEAIADLFRDKKVPLIWVGMPIMKSERLSADMLDFNQIYRDVAAKTGATYVDVWEAFTDDRGQFTAYGPDVTGQFVKIRTTDGVHFTRAGARTLAHFVEDDIRRDEQQARPPVDPALAALQPTGGLTGPQPAGTAPVQGQSGLAGVPLPAPPAAVVIPVKPAAGPIVPLNAPAVSPDGKLATLTPATTTSGAAQTLLDKALVEGHPLVPRPGRADDFNWPHP